MTLPTNCPASLRAVIEKHNYKRWRIAKELDVNVGHVQNYITEGIEPKRKDLREKMFFPTKRRADYRPPHWNWWRHLTPKERDALIKEAYDRKT